ncbi:GH92 family glycosyl hydrolase [Roseibacillus ishigakijimensis]|uniref:GH92 family glycosyl hydrolase n=1 Tax=Roseibacillus ishigakijimensis TaxID=454146 RepID=A0A934RMZ1_9BACT|nr:GH92 family glycosyl hydrolase [Roseibacillus ishigakijimensis]MBK1834772.1 GH92 family glycosyl hydrolase [Roseibacillus ishigakijimensis]
MKLRSLFTIFALAALFPGQAAEKTPADWVNPQIDTVKPRFFYFSSATRPFGLVNLSPDTQTDGTWDSGYRYNDEKIQCFSHIHGWQIAGLPVMPITSSGDLADYASRFSHEEEVVRAGYHQVLLQDHGINAELTSTTRVGFHRYTYPADQEARVILDLARKLMDHEMIAHEASVRADQQAVEGTFTMGPTGRRKKPFQVYFVAEFNHPLTRHGDWKDGKVVVDFGQLEKPLLMKVGLSYTGLDGARKNLATELPHWNFDQIVSESHAEWNEWLGKIEVEGGSDEQKTKFYTDLWHALQGRRIVSDVDHRYADNTGAHTVVRQGSRPHHNFDALWGAQWSINVLWPLAWPELMDNFANTMIDMYHNGGLIPRGPSGGNYTYVMIGDPASSFFSAAYHKGIRNWDEEAALAGLMRNAFPGGIRDHAGYETQTYSNGGGMAYYVNRGYVPLKIPKSQGGHRQGAAQTLEYSYQDWCLSQLADSLGRKEEAALLGKRATNYQNVWDGEIGWMRPRNKDGSWHEPFSPINDKGFTSPGFVESASAIYTFYIPHDLPGLAKLFGSEEAMAERLESNFEKAAPVRFIAEHGNHAISWVDYQNQPATGMAHVFNHIGQPWKSQYWVREVLAKTFSDTTPFGGYNGDEDQGLMGSLSALMALGLFDMSGGAAQKPHYDLTAPVFSKITIHLDPDYYEGKTFVIEAPEASPENVYIQGAKLNGREWNHFQFPHRAFAAGGTLQLQLGDEPNQEWGSAPN